MKLTCRRRGFGAAEAAAGTVSEDNFKLTEEANLKLREWDGHAARPLLRETGEFDRKLKPEGVTRIASGGRDFTFVVFDTSGYAAMN